MWAYLKSWFTGWFVCRHGYETMRSHNRRCRRVADRSSNDIRMVVKTSTMENLNQDYFVRPSNDASVQSNQNLSTNIDNAETERGNEFPRAGNCSCKNCATLNRFGVCWICSEPMQNREVWECIHCAIMMCGYCIRSRCRCCEMPMRVVRNLTVERLLSKMYLPCRNESFGCTKKLKPETRSRHEAKCEDVRVYCPLNDLSCKWRGKPIATLGHLQQCHHQKPIPTAKFTIQVTNLDKVYKKSGREVSYYFTCYSQLFAVAVQRKPTGINLGFHQIAYVGQLPKKSRAYEYSALMCVTFNTGEVVRQEVMIRLHSPHTRPSVDNSYHLKPRRKTGTGPVTRMDVEVYINEMYITDNDRY